MGRNLTRRDFVKAGSVTTAAALAGTVAAQQEDSPPIRIGLIGCGGRGTGAAENCLVSSPNVKLVAMGDMFQHRLNTSRTFLTKTLAKTEHPGMQVADRNCFLGFDAYKRVLDAGVDMVLLTTPPGFRPIHFQAAIEADKHVFFEKPVAVDPVGIRRVIKYGEIARKKKLGVVAGTQNRHHAPVIEMMRRIHDGQIGRIVSARSYRNSGPIWVRPRKEGQSDMEYQVQNWYYFNWLSGDHIVEQHVHLQDMMNWAMGSHPVEAVGVGGRIQRTGAGHGNIYDHFAVDYVYPNNVHCFHIGRQMKRCSNHIGIYIEGTKGSASYAYRKTVIEGENPWTFEGKSRDPRVQEHADLIGSIRRGKPLNVARRIAESTLTSIMGREVAYTGKRIKWDALMNSPMDLTPKKFEYGPFPMRPVPIPGS